MNLNSINKSRRSFFLKIILPSITTIILFILLFYLLIIPAFESAMMDKKREMIRELTNSVWSILLKYEREELTGKLTRTEAQANAIDEIRQLRYGDEMKDYFWITDMNPSMIMHPYRTDLDGKSLTDFKDPHGKYMFVEFVDVVKEHGQGYVDYMWQWKDDSTRIVPKLSYVKLFKSWGWIIGTGIYLEDVKTEIRNMENRLLRISLIITILIVVMLVLIMRQSTRIESKRLIAEQELQLSRERYKALVEAATEGLIMLLNGKVSFINKVISEITGFTRDELIEKHISEILSENNPNGIIKIFNRNSIENGQYEANLRTSNGGFSEVMISVTDAVFYGNPVNILTVKDMAVERQSNISNLDYLKMLNTLDFGIFRASLDKKGKFISANETALQILGLSNFKELSDKNILELLAESEDRKYLSSVIMKNGFLKNKIIRINKKNHENVYISVSLVAYKNDETEHLICDGIFVDVSESEQQKSETNQLITHLKMSGFILDQPVNDFIKDLHILDSESDLKKVLDYLSNQETDCVFLTKNQNDVLGVITKSDIQDRILQFNLNLDNPAFLIMSSPVYSANENSSVYEAVTLCEEKKINHLLIKDQSGQPKGVFCLSDVNSVVYKSLTYILQDVKEARSAKALKKCSQKFQEIIKPVISSGIDVGYITKMISLFSDAAIKRVISLSIADIGEPPLRFAFICMGSEGRKEETLLTDQDNAIIFEEPEKENYHEVQAYFNLLGEKICNTLDFIGFYFCKGNIMAKNPMWCKPVNVWEQYFSNWISTPEPQNLLEAMIFFDFRYIYGDSELISRLKTRVLQLVKQHPGFLYHMAYNTYNVKHQHVTAGNILSEKNADLLDLKASVSPITMFARVYALQNNVDQTNTVERILTLRALNILANETADEILFAYNYLMKLRLRNQVDQIRNNLPLSNYINTRKLIEVEIQILKKVLSIIPSYQGKISNDFRIST